MFTKCLPPPPLPFLLSSPLSPSLPTLLLQAILAPLQGFLNALVYGWTRKEFRKALNVGDRIKSLGRGYQSVTGKTDYNSGGSMNLNCAVPT